MEIKLVQLSKFGGATLGTRSLGEAVRKAISSHLNAGCTVRVDFNGVDVATQGFLDEAFAKLYWDFPQEVLQERCLFAGMSDTIASVLGVVLRERRSIQS